MAPHDLVGLVARVRPFMGQLGTTPAIPMPDSHNAGDFGSFLIGAPHEYGLAAEQLANRTDGHLDIDAVRAGAVLICPVKTPGGGIYLGDMHAMQGDGEIAGHTADVAGTVTLQVHLLKGLGIDGPILLPVVEDLPFLARPLTAEERKRAEAVAKAWGIDAIEESAPISVIGTGPDLNSATDNGLERAARLLGMTVPEVKNRATITGAIEIGRHPGVVQVTFRAPLAKLEALGLLPFIRDQYGIG
jgi:acetamidase/formamidase